LNKSPSIYGQENFFIKDELDFRMKSCSISSYGVLSYDDFVSILKMYP